MPETPTPVLTKVKTAEKIATDENPNGIFRLHRPITLDGREVTELRLDFDQLSLADLENIEAEMGGTVIKNPAFSIAYNLYVGARAAGININDLRAAKMSLKDSERLARYAQSFLMQTESEA